MPTHVEKRGGKRRYKIIENSTGRVVGSALTASQAKVSSSIRNRASKRKHGARSRRGTSH